MVTFFNTIKYSIINNGGRMKVNSGVIKFNYEEINSNVIQVDDLGKNKVSNQLIELIDELKYITNEVNQFLPEILKEPEEIRQNFEKHDEETSKEINNER